jgi:tetratricopeptide (TPR) repeat protein
MTQNNLGNALQRLGQRESGTARLEEAVAACREALKEYTRERVPLQWATTQNNLGNALGSLGERESGTARLEEAVAAYREALKERTRERVPLQWKSEFSHTLGQELRQSRRRPDASGRTHQRQSACRSGAAANRDRTDSHARCRARNVRRLLRGSSTGGPPNPRRNLRALLSDYDASPPP